jgi:hypothetical protein
VREKRISYAKSKSHATLCREDPNFIPPNFAHAASAKRVREAEESNVRSKREKVADADDEEMDIEDDDETGPPASTTSNSTSCISPTVINLCNDVSPPQLSIQRKYNLPTSCSAQIFRRKSQMVFWRYYSNSAYR